METEEHDNATEFKQLSISGKMFSTQSGRRNFQSRHERSANQIK